MLVMASQPPEETPAESPVSPSMESLLPELTRTKQGYLIPRETHTDNATDGFLFVHEMFNMLNSGFRMPFILDPHYMLILDARKHSKYLSSHLVSARHYNAIETDYDCLLHAGKLDKFKFIVMYDESSKAGEIGEVLTDLNLRIKERHSPYILDGGFTDFQSAYPFLCTDKIILTEKERYQEIQTYPSMVLGGVLYQGNGKQATSKRVIKDLGITHIVNITVEYENAFPDMVDYLHLKFRDELGSNLEHRLSTTADFIANAIRGGGRVLVHCVQGISRSSTITLSFLMKYYAWPLRDAYNFLKDKRSAVYPNMSFIKQLGNYERDLFGKRISDVDQIY